MDKGRDLRSLAGGGLACRCITEERAAIMWADKLITMAEADRMADSGEICVGCLGVYDDMQAMRGTPEETGKRA